MKTLTIVLTDGPYISEYSEIACKLAEEALKQYHVNIFLYLDAVHIPKKSQNPSFFTNTGELFTTLAEKGAVIRACARCAAARGYITEGDTLKGSNCKDYLPGIKISSLYELAEMLKKSDRVISLSR
ncbi:DsrE/DsrF/TusD sulfur relay family protein [Methanosarcina sp.]|uniref:DsrE/DsrF/TusD sulfur relay family protein n=1 Tax=Methanosarcina sp. TaxID=2213 RepID=UPI00298979C3|nr:DsrE family protein [Methanosarcina sp.]MDW5550454.1 DsrE family protein [Methanosarcina sp.]MDW5554778.1 DsrE family protein [Methanosarcina sp.]MDW5559923.1 DsrE family protein [Methanosarcina sp.]